MLASTPRNRRAFLRIEQVTGEVPGRLLTLETPLEGVRAKDVSRRGLGLISPTPLEPGQDVWLVTRDRGLRFEVRYCKEEQANGKTVYRCGLMSSAPWENLVSLFVSEGYAFLDI